MKLIGNVIATINGQPVDGLRSVQWSPRKSAAALPAARSEYSATVEIPKAEWTPFRRELLRAARARWHATVRNRPGRYWRRRLPAWMCR